MGSLVIPTERVGGEVASSGLVASWEVAAEAASMAQVVPEKAGTVGQVARAAETVEVRPVSAMGAAAAEASEAKVA